MKTTQDVAGRGRAALVDRMAIHPGMDIYEREAAIAAALAGTQDIEVAEADHLYRTGQRGCLPPHWWFQEPTKEVPDIAIAEADHLYRIDREGRSA
jgi:hypothetical protein